jgi:hypothetical protein
MHLRFGCVKAALHSASVSAIISDHIRVQASAFVGLLPMCDISIDIADADRRSRHTALKDGQPATYLVFSGDDAVSGAG